MPVVFGDPHVVFVRHLDGEERFTEVSAGSRRNLLGGDGKGEIDGWRVMGLRDDWQEDGR